MDPMNHCDWDPFVPPLEDTSSIPDSCSPIDRMLYNDQVRLVDENVSFLLTPYHSTCLEQPIIDLETP